MSWQTNALLIQKDFSDDFLGMFSKLGLNGAELAGTISFDDAASFSNEGVAAEVVNGWTALWGHIPLYMVKEECLQELAVYADIFQMYLEGTSGTAGFSWWCEGKSARKYVRQAGTETKNEGTPLPFEASVFDNNDDEQAVLQILETLTVPLKELSAVPYQHFIFSLEALYEM